MAQAELTIVTRLKDEASNALSSLGGSIGNMAKMAGVAMAAVGAAAVGGLGMAVKGAADFEQAMANVGAISRASDEDLARLTATAKEMGATTAFTAKQAAEGMSFLAMAGFDVNETIAAMPGLLSMAAAGNIDLATTADIASNILSGFNIDASETGRVADVLTATFTTANVDLRMLGEGMKYAAPLMASLGVSVEETAAAMGKLGDAGIQGTMAGTALRSIMGTLAAPTGAAAKEIERLGISLTNADGTMRELPELIGEFERATAGMSDTQKTATLSTIFGERALASMLVLLNVGEEELATYTDTLRDSGGVAEEVAGKQLDTLKGQLTLLGSAFDGVRITIGDVFLPVLKDIVTAAIPVVDMIGTQLATAIETVSTIFGVMASTWERTGSITSTLAVGLSGLLQLFGMTPQQVVPIIQSFREVAGVVEALVEYFRAVVEDGDHLNDFLTHLPESIRPVVEAIGAMAAGFQEGGLRGAIDALLPYLQAALNSLIAYVQSQLPAWQAQLMEWGAALWRWLVDVVPLMHAQWVNLRAQLFSWIVSVVESLPAQFAAWGAAFVEWITPAATYMMANLPHIVNVMLDWIERQAGPLVTKLGQWAKAFVEWIIPLIPQLPEALIKILVAVTYFIGTAAGTIIKRLVEWADAFLGWVEANVLPVIATELMKIVTRITNWITGTAVPRIKAEAARIGASLLEGIGQGIRDNFPNATAAVEWAINGLVSTARRVGIMRSPSKLMADKVGKPLGEGIILGLQQALAGGTIRGTLRHVFEAIENLLTGEIDDFVEDFISIMSDAGIHPSNMPWDALTYLQDNLKVVASGGMGGGIGIDALTRGLDALMHGEGLGSLLGSLTGLSEKTDDYIGQLARNPFYDSVLREGSTSGGYAATSGGAGMFAGATINIYANDYAGGRAAGAGFHDELRSRGLA